MKKYIKDNHLSLISIFIGLVSLSGVVILNISNYFHQNELKNQNKENHLSSLKYYDEFYKVIKNRSLDKPFSDIESSEMYNNLLSGCYYKVTNDIKDDKTLVDTSCTSIVINIYSRLISFNSELKREEILQELDKLKNKVNILIKN